MTEAVFSIATQFSRHPGPRFKHQGANSGETLRGQLVNLLERHRGEVLIDLDGTRGMGSSFLDEAFGGLVRKEGMAKDDLLKRLKFVSRVDPSYVDEIYDSISRSN
jgi:hypothetical protein